MKEKGVREFLQCCELCFPNTKIRRGFLSQQVWYEARDLDEARDSDTWSVRIAILRCSADERYHYGDVLALVSG